MLMSSAFAMTPEANKYYRAACELGDKSKYSEAVELFKKQQYSECESALEKAKESADWIIKNAPLREKAKKYLQEIADLMKTDKSNISAEKIDSAQKAYLYYSNGNFEQALNELENNFFVNR